MAPCCCAEYHFHLHIRYCFCPHNSFRLTGQTPHCVSMRHRLCSAPLPRHTRQNKCPSAVFPQRGLFQPTEDINSLVWLHVVVWLVASGILNEVRPSIRMDICSVYRIMHYARLIMCSISPVILVPIVIVKVDTVVMCCQFLNGQSTRTKT